VRLRVDHRGDPADPWPGGATGATTLPSSQAPCRQGIRHPALRAYLRRRGIGVRIARKGIESSDRLGRHRWTVERTIAWLTGYRRLATRYERRADNLTGLLHLACSLIALRFLTPDTGL
jgi:transposase